MSKATRDGFGEQLVESAQDNLDIIVLTADLGKATKVDKFSKKFPERFFECGIAENNMIGISSGLSEYGYKVFLSSFGSFLTGKYDTIRCSIAYPKSPCILIGTHSGLSIGRDGVTQMGLEDMSLMRSLPNMVVLNPATYLECRNIVKYLCDNKLNSPYYLRLGRQPVEEIFDESYVFEIGKGIVVKKGESGVIFSTGCILPDVIKAIKDLDFEVVNFPTIKPIDYNLVKSYGEKYSNIFTVEDHSIIGGLGTAVAEVIAENGLSVKLHKIGLNDVFPESGKPTDLYDKYGLSPNKIRERVLNENR